MKIETKLEVAAHFYSRDALYISIETKIHLNPMSGHSCKYQQQVRM